MLSLQANRVRNPYPERTVKNLSSSASKLCDFEHLSLFNFLIFKMKVWKGQVTCKVYNSRQASSGAADSTSQPDAGSASVISTLKWGQHIRHQARLNVKGVRLAPP